MATMSTPPSSSLHAVITADVVESTSSIPAERREAFADELRAAYKRMQEQLPDALPYPIAVFGGDSWQCYIDDPKAALRVGLYLRAWTRFAFDVDTRFALAVDTVNFVDEHNVAESDGAAFRVSGRMAEDLDKKERLLIWLLFGAPERYRRLEEITAELLDASGNTVARLADRVARSWTSAQAQAVTQRLLDLSVTHEEIAQRWEPEPVTHQSISKHLTRAGWADLEGALRYYERIAGSALGFSAWLDATKPIEPR